MAKKPSNSRSKAPANAAINVVAQAVAATIKAFTPLLGGMIADAQAASAASQSRSKSAAEAIAALYASVSDADARKGAIVEVFGNGIKGKAHVKGKLAESLPKDAPVSVRSFLSQCRSTAESWNNTVTVEGADGKPHTCKVADVAAERGIRAAYDAAKPKAPPADDAPSAKAPTLSELIAEKIKADGVVSVLAIVESACKATAKVLEQERVHATIVALSAK